MPLEGPYAMLASMDIDETHRAIFDEVYDREHIPTLRRVPGVLSVARFVSEAFAMRIGGESKPFDGAGFPTFTAVYELASPDVVASEAWAEAVEQGRWPSQVRPHTRNRLHVMLKKIP
jgi:hypothetical protein